MLLLAGGVCHVERSARIPTKRGGSTVTGMLRINSIKQAEQLSTVWDSRTMQANNGSRVPATLLSLG